MTRALTLAIEASTYQGSAALAEGRKVVAERTVAMRGERSERLMPAVAELLAELGVAATLDGVIVGAGPGSFTSLRIAGSLGKGIAFASGVPLYAISSLALIVAGAKPALPPGRYLASLDAMRGDRYAAIVAVSDTGRVGQTSPTCVMPMADVTAWARHESVVHLGPDCVIALYPHARGAALVGDTAGTPVDLASWEPGYGRPAEAQARWEAAHGRPLGPA